MQCTTPGQHSAAWWHGNAMDNAIQVGRRGQCTVAVQCDNNAMQLNTAAVFCSLAVQGSSGQWGD